MCSSIQSCHRLSFLVFSGPVPPSAPRSCTHRNHSLHLPCRKRRRWTRTTWPRRAGPRARARRRAAMRPATPTPWLSCACCWTAARVRRGAERLGAWSLGPLLCMAAAVVGRKTHRPGPALASLCSPPTGAGAAGEEPGRRRAGGVRAAAAGAGGGGRRPLLPLVALCHARLPQVSFAFSWLAELAELPGPARWLPPARSRPLSLAPSCLLLCHFAALSRSS